MLGNLLPGPGTLYESQFVRFLGRAHVGDELSVSVQVTDKRPPHTVVLATTIRRGDTLLADGTAEVLAPLERHVIEDTDLPGVTVARHRNVARLMAACRPLPPMRTAVVAPEEENALLGALAGAREGLIVPILIGNAAAIRATAASMRRRPHRHRDRGRAEP